MVAVGAGAGRAPGRDPRLLLGVVSPSLAPSSLIPISLILMGQVWE